MVSVKEKKLDNFLFILVAFATGTILASALFDLIPESIHHLEELNADGYSLNIGYNFVFIMVGYISFFIIGRFIYWFHGHAHQQENQLICYDAKIEGAAQLEYKGKNIRNVAILNLIGDGLHNFLDGIIIMVAFLTGFANGIIITLAVLAHELPQEVGDYGILLYGGFTKKKALLFNFLSAMVALIGGIIAFLLVEQVDLFNLFFLAFSGGGFIYLACSELMPEILKQKQQQKSVIQSLLFLAGIALIIILILILPHE